MRATRTPADRVVPALSWERLLVGAAATDFLLLLGSGIVLGDAEAVTLAVVLLLTTAWLAWRPGRLVVLLRALAFVDVLFFMAPATISNLSAHESFAAVSLPLALMVTSTLGLAATVAWLRLGSLRAAPRRSPLVAAALTVSVFLAGAGVAATTAGGGAQAGAGDLILTARNAKFSSTSLQAHSGAVTLDLTNDDLFWHTVTIDALRVDLKVPVKGHRSVTFRAAPGTYSYYCAIPGHAALGMRGTLHVT